MTEVRFEKISRWLSAVLLILLLLTAVTLPLVTERTYSGSSDSPDRILTYTSGQLTWDTAAGVNANGTAELDLFQSAYDNVTAQDGANIIAPGTEGQSIVRLKNDAEGSVDYTAILYRIESDSAIPVEAALNGEGLTAAADYQLPEGITADQVIQAAAGTVEGGALLDLEVAWAWEFSADAGQDAADTQLGNQAEPDTLTVGLYISVEDESGGTVVPEVPGQNPNPNPSQNPNSGTNTNTGDSSRVGIYITLLLVSLLALAILLLAWRRRKKCRE